MLAAIQAVIFSLPLSFSYGMSRVNRMPKDEFSGIAVFGTMLIAGAITAAVMLVIAFAVVLVAAIAFVAAVTATFVPLAVRLLEAFT